MGNRVNFTCNLIQSAYYSMKNISYIWGFLFLLMACQTKKGSDIFQNGDIIFQTSKSGQSKAIQLATGSQYSHVGILYKQGEHFFVYEAVQPVKQTPLDEWINRGLDGHYVVKRVKNAEKLLTDENLLSMKKVGERYQGKDYDWYFEWSDDRMYCSELVWKIYHEALGIEIGKRKKLREFNLTDETVQAVLKERYGDSIPLDEWVISPADMFESDQLVTVCKH